MADYNAVQIDPFKLGYIAFSGSTGHTTYYSSTISRDLICYTNPDLISNDGYPLGNITQSPSYTEGGLSSSNGLVWLKIAAGVDVDPIYLERAAKIRTELAERLFTGPETYSQRLSLVYDLATDLDVSLISEAIRQRAEFPTSWQTKSLSDINTLLQDTKVYNGTTPYSFGDLDMDGTITSYLQDSPINVFIKDQVVSINTGKFTVNDNNNNPILEYATGSGTVKNLTNDRYFWVGANDVTDYYYVSSMTYLVAAKNNIYYRLPITGGRQVGVPPNTTVSLWSIASPDPNYPSVTASSLQNYFTGAYFRVLERIDAPIEDGDKDHWLNLYGNYVLNRWSRYLALLYYVHFNYGSKPELNKLILKKIEINSKRIRTTDIEGIIQQNGTIVRKIGKTSFSTDFKYLKKDPAGQFKIGGMARCPAFAGTNTNGIIPDNNVFGTGIIEVYQHYTSYNGVSSGRPEGTPLLNYISADSNWYFHASIHETIGFGANPLFDSAVDLPSTSSHFATGSMRVTGVVLNYVTRNQQGQSQILALTGLTGYTVSTDNYGTSGRVVNANSGNYMLMSIVDNVATITILPNWKNHITYNATLGYHIPRGEVVVSLSPSVLLNAPFYSNSVSGTKLKDYLYGIGVTSFRVKMGWEFTGINGIVIPTNFDFLETP